MAGRALRTAAVGASVLVSVWAGAPAAAAGQDPAVAAELSDPAERVCLTEIREAWETPEPYVHDRITEVLPEVTPQAVAESFEHDRSVRVAVLPGPHTDPGELAEQLHAQGDRRTAVLYSWQDGAFRVDTVTGGAPPVTGVGHRIDADDLLVHMEALAVVLRGEVIPTAAQALAGTSLYVAPGLTTDLTAQQVEDLAERFASLAEPVRVALLPSEAVGYEGAVVRRGAGNVAELVQGERDAPVVVYLVDGEGHVVAGSASGPAAGSRFGSTGDGLSRIAEAARDGDSAAATLTNLVERLDTAPAGGDAVERAAEFLRYALPFLLVLGAGLALVIPVRRAEKTIRPENGADGDAVSPPQEN